MVSTRRGCFRTTFTNGILAAQWLSNVLMEDGVVEADELINKLSDPEDVHRKYLAGDVLPLIHEFFKRKGEFYMSLYELEDEELETILEDNADRIHMILSNTSATNKLWDTRNKAARKRMMDAGVDIQHRMFNNATHIGHNKFVVHVNSAGKPTAVLTGSTNWTSTGVAGQTNNALLIEDGDVAQAFMDYWERMRVDELKVPKPFSRGMTDSQQSAAFRTANSTAIDIKVGGQCNVQLWFSPNTPERRKPVSKTKPARVPPDLQEVYRLMRRAEEAILFLAFYPGQRGVDCMIGEAIAIGDKDPGILVTGAVSSAQAMPNYVPSKKEEGEVVEGADSPSTYDNAEGNVSIVRAAAIDDRNLLGDFGAEQLAARGRIGAIIHDKLVVIDPRSKNPTVILGSHNLGYKASYSNDENMVIVRGDKALAEAYAVHILDVYDHYRFRAIETEIKRRNRKKKKGAKKLQSWSGFLSITDDWQDGYVEGRKGALMRYFAR
jgi:phosphatidylserine/phosphatidylglycerophosphate/cardiolipin synthase-like enzyme